jgi:2-dehydropantoate 2-reductase
MKIAVVGVGAMGSVYAALLADAGNEVWAVDIWRDHIDAINAKGLRVEGASGDRTVRLNATTDASTVGTCDMVVIATKAAGVAGAAEAAASMMRADSVIVTIQNGLGAAERIKQTIDSDAILIGVAGGFGASMKGPGHAHHNGMELIRLGEMVGGMTPRLEKTAKVWNEGGFEVKAFEDIDQLIWEKFICNVALSGTCAVTGLTTGGIIGDPDAWKLASTLTEEAYAVGRAKGIHFGFDDPVEYVRKFGLKIPHARASMWQDLDAGRRTEVDAINGAVPVAAAEVGLTAPFNEAVAAIIKARESVF